MDDDQFCVCGRPAVRIIQAPHIFVQKNICYDSPIDGRPITSKQARQEDLARAGCVEYEAGMKQDYEQRIAESEKALETKVDSFVDQAVSAMPARKREKLTAEIQGGLEAEPVRITPHETSIRRTA